METTVQEIRVFKQLEPARTARREYIASGCRPQDVRILDAESFGLTRLLDGPPIPEAVAGFVVFSVVAMGLAVIPQLTPLFYGGGMLAVAAVLVGGLAGAMGSYFIARANPQGIVDEPIETGDYVVIAQRATVRADAA